MADIPSTTTTRNTLDTATWIESSGVVSASDIAYKLLFAAAGCLALVWSVSVLPTSWAYRDLEAIGYRVSLDHAFDANVLNGVEPVADRVLAEQSCHSSALRSAVFTKLRLYELLEAKADRTSLDSRSNELRKAVRVGRAVTTCCHGFPR